MKKFAYLLLCCILSACAGKAALPATPTAPQPFDSATSEITQQIISTLTIAPTPSVKTPSTPIPTKTVQADSTEQAYNMQATKIAEFPAACALESGDTFISPNGNWLTTQCSAIKEGYNLEIVNKEGKHWAVRAKDYVSDDLSGLRPEHWSKDGEYLYFSSNFGGSSGGYACFPDSGIVLGLYRIKLNDGTVATILPAGRVAYDFAFSPTGRLLAYRGLRGLIILDLQTGDEINIKVGNNTTGTLTWSPDGLELAYATCQENPNGYGFLDDYSPQKSAVEIFSIQQNASRSILEIEKKLLLVESWNANNILAIFIQDEHNLGYEQFFDLNTNQWITPTPTP